MPTHLIERPVPGATLSRTGRASRTVTVNLAESPLSWLHARKMISDRQFAAGSLLHADYMRGELAQRTTMAWDPAPADKSNRARGADMATIGAIDARDRFHAACATAGPGLTDVLWRVVCAGDRIPDVERTLGWPSRSGKLVLTLALDRIADYYRVP
jgi:hypothetical protein